MRFSIFIFSVLAISLSFSACKTCEPAKDVQDTIIEQLAGQGYCGGYDAMKDDVGAIVKALDVCGDFDTASVVAKIPDGTWTPKGMACWAAIRKLLPGDGKIVTLVPAWKCQKKEIPFSALENACHQLD
jgi:hypothetical protein